MYRFGSPGEVIRSRIAGTELGSRSQTSVLHHGGTVPNNDDMGLERGGMAPLNDATGPEDRATGSLNIRTGLERGGAVPFNDEVELDYGEGGSLNDRVALKHGGADKSPRTGLANSNWRQNSAELGAGKPPAHR